MRGGDDFIDDYDNKQLTETVLIATQMMHACQATRLCTDANVFYY